MIVKLILDYIFLTRPVVLIPVWAFSFLGYYVALNYGILSFVNLFGTVSLSTVFKILVFSLSVSAVNIFNQVADYETDKANDGFPLLVNVPISNKSAFAFGIILALISVVLPLIFFGDYLMSLFSVLAILTGLIYSFKPTYFTGRPFLDFLTNAFGFGVVAFLLGWHISSTELNLLSFKFSFSYFSLMAAGSISSTLPDINGDKKNGKITTAVLLGKRKSNVLATFFIVIAILYAHYIEDSVAVWAGIISLPLYVLYSIYPMQIFMETTYKVGGGLLMLITALVFPQFAVCALVSAVATVVYFRFRHRVVYPSLLPAESIDD